MNSDVISRRKLFRGMPSPGSKKSFSKATNHYTDNADLLARLNTMHLELPTDYGLSDCKNQDTIVKGTHKYFETQTRVLDESSILATMTWLRSAFSLPLQGFKTFNEIYLDMPKTTSAGFPFKGKKRDIPMEDVYQEFISFLSEKYTECGDMWKSFNK